MVHFRKEFQDIHFAIPTKRDILCGKDKSFGRHPANQSFAQVIETYKLFYTTATSKQSKMKLTKEIVNVMHSKYHGRFLKFNKLGEWEELSDAQARDKVSHALRFAVNKSNGDSQSTATSESSSSSSSSSSSVTSDEVEENIRASYDLTPISLSVDNDENCDILHHSQRLLEQRHDSFSDHDWLDYSSSDDKFDTLRSEDLEAIFSQPIDNNEWDEAMALAMESV